MLLIWNDNETELIEDSDDFDRSQNVIPRKVFLKFKADAKNKDEQWIRAAFKKFKEIESVEIFEERDHTWAYVTYVDNNDVIYALHATRLEEIELIVPADTWVQPEPLSSSEQDTEKILAELNEFETAHKSGQSRTDRDLSLRELILMAANSTVPSVTEALNRILPLVQSFEFQSTNATGTVIPLTEVRSILRCIGQHITELSFVFRMGKYPKHIERYYQKICQYVGPQLKTLKLNGVPPIQDWLIGLKPILCRVECFCVKLDNYDFDYDIDFELYCPNVKILAVSSNLNGTLLSKSKLPKLRKMSMMHNQYMEESLVLDFMKNHSQLVYLTIEAHDCDNLLKQIPMHLPKLEHLCLHQGHPNITGQNLDHLTGLKELKSLGLLQLDGGDFNGILNCLPKFRQLESLQLHILYDGPDKVDLAYLSKPDLNAITTLAQELVLLKSFDLRYCRIDAETLQNFVRYAKNLVTFVIRGCGLEITDTILENIETIRSGEGAATTVVLYADKIHPELNREKMYSTVKLMPSALYKF